VLGDLGDPDIAARAVDGVDAVDAVVHLAGIPTPGTAWTPLVRAGVTRLILASSVHVTDGYADRSAWPVDPQWPAAPCCRYGASKATTELLAQLFATELSAWTCRR